MLPRQNPLCRICNIIQQAVSRTSFDALRVKTREITSTVSERQPACIKFSVATPITWRASGRSPRRTTRASILVLETSARRNNVIRIRPDILCFIFPTVFQFYYPIRPCVISLACFHFNFSQPCMLHLNLYLPSLPLFWCSRTSSWILGNKVKHKN